MTHRGVAHEFTVVSGHVPPDHDTSLVDWDALARMRGTVVLLMAVENLPAIAARLTSAGRSPADPGRGGLRGDHAGGADRAVHPRGGRRGRRAGAVRPPAIVVVGDVVAVANPDRYPWQR